MQVGASILTRVLQRLPRSKQAAGGDILIGLDAPDDAAVIRPPPAGHVLVQTVDFFKQFVSDPYVFGAIAANHALGVSRHHLRSVKPRTYIFVCCVSTGAASFGAHVEVL